MIAIIDYGMGNVASVQKAFNYIGCPSQVTHEANVIRNADFIVLPGVGSFLQGMQNLKERGLLELLTDEVIRGKKPFMGICLGMQLIFTDGTEPVTNKGLGWIEGSVVKFEKGVGRIPHMGWNNIQVRKPDYFAGLENRDFYFIHSYHVKPVNAEVIAATTEYGTEVVASVQQDNIFATQFHPEKSQEAGLKLLTSFFKDHAQSQSYTYPDL